MEEKLLWRAYRKSPTLLRMVPSATPYDLLFLQIRVHRPQRKFQLLLPQERLRLRVSNFLCTFIESIRTKAHQNNLGKVSIGVVWESQKFPGHSYKAHRAVIFAIAQLSCIIIRSRRACLAYTYVSCVCLCIWQNHEPGPIEKKFG